MLAEREKKGKGYRVIHDDFLTLHTYKHYDLIITNPPFSVGAHHLLKAIEVQETSDGAIICLLNAEMLRNPYRNERKAKNSKLAESDLVAAFVAQYNREIEYVLRIYDELQELGEKSLDGEKSLGLALFRYDYERDLEKFSINGYVKAVRRKYWNKFFSEPRFIGRLTGKLLSEYCSKIDSLINYDFLYWNIKMESEY